MPAARTTAGRSQYCRSYSLARSRGVRGVFLRFGGRLFHSNVRAPVPNTTGIGRAISPKSRAAPSARRGWRWRTSRAHPRARAPPFPGPGPWNTRRGVLAVLCPDR